MAEINFAETIEMNLPDRPVHGSRNESAYQAIRAAIERGDLKAGQRVMEVEVGEWLGVSRTPVRAALRRLEAEGILEMQARVGLVVTSLSPQAVLELYEVRELLEAKAAGLCAVHATALEIAELREIVQLEQRLRDADELVRTNRLFHEAIHRGAHNRYLAKSLGPLNDSMWLLGPSQMRVTRRARPALLEHAEIFAAIERRDPVAAEAATRAHVRGAKHERMKTLFPESTASQEN